MSADVGVRGDRAFVRRGHLVMTGVILSGRTGVARVRGTYPLTCCRDYRRTSNHERRDDGNQSAHHRREYT